MKHPITKYPFIMMIFVFLALFSSSFHPTHGSEFPKSDVVVLNSSNFDSFIAEGTWLVEFYAPWCGHCKRFAPSYEELATELKIEISSDSSFGIRVAKIDGSENKLISMRFLIKGFPSFFRIQDRIVHRFVGARTKDNLKDFAIGKTVATNSELRESSNEKIVHSELVTKSKLFGPVSIPWRHFMTVWNKAQYVLQAVEDRGIPSYVVVGSFGMFAACFIVFLGFVFNLITDPGSPSAQSQPPSRNETTRSSSAIVATSSAVVSQSNSDLVKDKKTN